MTSMLKKIAVVGFVYLFAIIGLQAQVAVLQFRHVPQENISEFLHRETTYWAEVAKKAVADEKLIGWELWQRVGGVNMDANSHNFVFVNIFADKTAMDNMGGIWNPSETFPNARMSDMETNSLSHTIHQIVVRFHEGVGTGGNFARVNFAKVSDMENYVAFETGVWRPFIEGLMKSKKTQCVGWNLAHVLSPGGSLMPFNAFSVDHFDKLSEAIEPSWGEDIEFPDFEPYTKTNTRVAVQVYGAVKKVYADE